MPTARRAGKTWWQVLWGKVWRAGVNRTDPEVQAEVVRTGAQAALSNAEVAASNVIAGIGSQQDVIDGLVKDLEQALKRRGVALRRAADAGVDSAEYGAHRQRAIDYQRQVDSLAGKLEQANGRLVTLKGRGEDAHRQAKVAQARTRELAEKLDDARLERQYAETIEASNKSLDALGGILAGPDNPTVDSLLRNARERVHAAEALSDIRGGSVEMQAVIDDLEAQEADAASTIDTMLAGDTDPGAVDDSATPSEVSTG